MSWYTSDRRAGLPKDWHRIRARVWRAAGGQCQWLEDDGTRCTWVGRLNGDGGQVDHANHRDDHESLQWLCRPHHNIKTAREAAAGRAASGQPRASRTRPIERHPGSLR